MPLTIFPCFLIKLLLQKRIQLLSHLGIFPHPSPLYSQLSLRRAWKVPRVFCIQNVLTCSLNKDLCTDAQQLLVRDLYLQKKEWRFVRASGSFECRIRNEIIFIYYLLPLEFFTIEEEITNDSVYNMVHIQVQHKAEGCRYNTKKREVCWQPNIPIPQSVTTQIFG